MNSSTLKSFWQLFHALPPDARRDAREAFKLFQTDPSILDFSSKRSRAERVGGLFALTAVTERWVFEAAIPSLGSGSARTTITFAA